MKRQRSPESPRPPRDFAVRVRRFGGGLALGALLWLAQTAAAAPVSPLAGRYRITQSGPYGGGIVDIDPRRSAYTVNARLDTGKSLRGLGLADGPDLLGASLYTGGVAHGLAIYRRDLDGRRWRGQWITSIDSASTIGAMDFDADPKQPTLAGRHHFSGHRVSTGQFDGTVTMNPQGDNFSLSFTTAGGATLYKAVGILCGERLVVAWSFGSSPALVVYQLDARGELTGRRLSLRSRSALEPSTERLIPADASVVATGPAPGAASNAQPRKSEGLSAAEPGAPAVKMISYSDLISRYGSAGWAERWLNCQLTNDEHRLLDLAVRRHSVGDAATQTLGARTVAQLIDEQRRFQSP